MNITTAIYGGLGNQMFQYAAGRALAFRLGADLKLDLSWFDTAASVDMPRRYMLEVFSSLAVVPAAPEECAHFARAGESRAGRFLRRLCGRPRPYAGTYAPEPYYAYWPGFERIVAPAYLSGYWQNERYFSAVSDLIRRDFSFPPLLSSEGEDLGGRIRAAHASVCVHIRRGDYVTNPAIHAFHGICAPEYYKKALDIVAAQAGQALELFIFSDDPLWARGNFDTRGFPATVVDLPEHVAEPWHDMHLMRLCRHHIIANSSFSWWGAWLADAGGVVCCPERWFAAQSGMEGHPAPERWVRL